LGRIFRRRMGIPDNAAPKANAVEQCALVGIPDSHQPAHAPP
jgi:hypothetical protein